MSETIPTIDICIATYHREELLRDLLAKLAVQETQGRFQFSIIVADNSAEGTAESVVTDSASQRPEIPHQYLRQPVKNISRTRNVAVAASSGEFIAFIDDDEVPATDWLLQHFNTLEKYNVDVVHGPVLPIFENDAPDWVLASQYFTEDKRETGYQGYYPAATNNCLVRADILRKQEGPFSEAYGISGGEDSEMFYRLKQQGYKFCWCQEAQVSESIPSSRTTVNWLTKRFFRQGNSFVRIRVQHGNLSTYGFYLAKALVKILLIGVLLPFALIIYPIRQRPAFALLHRLLMTSGELWSLTGNHFKEYAKPAQSNQTSG